MDRFDNVINILDYTLESDRRKHIVGGILISFSLLFAGFAITAITLDAIDFQQK